MRIVAVVIAVVAAFVLGAAGGYAAKTVNLLATSPSYHFVAGQGGSSQTDMASNLSTRRGGNLSLGGSAAQPAGSSYRAPGSRRGGPQAS